jgi:branched-chain amino acid transport system ATP-binding protein
MLEVNDVHTYYGDSYVLQGVSLAVASNEVVAILGRNGVGKTTLVRSVIGLSPPRRGSISFKGRSLAGVPAYRIARLGIGLVPQGRQIFPSLTVLENLRVTARGQRTGQWTPDRVIDFFPNLSRRRHQYAGKLSGGEQQMLAIGRALVSNPDLLLMDEPSEGLSPVLVKQLGAVIETLRGSGTSVLLVEQQLRFAIRYADRVYIMSKGQIVHRCPASELKSDMAVLSQHLGI